MKTLPIILLTLFATLSFAQTYSGSAGCPKNADKKKIEETQKQALQDLLSQIAVNVQSDFKNVLVENEKGLTQTCEAVLKTYSAFSLTNLKPGKHETKDEIIFSYSIEKQEVENVFALRTKQAEGLFKSACDAQAKNNLEQALKWFFQADLLLKSIPLTYSKGKLTEQNCIEKITEIIENLSFNIKKDFLENSTRKILVETSFNKKPVETLKLSYENGYNYIPTEVNHGEFFVLLDGEAQTKKELAFEIEYQFPENKNQNQTVSEVWDLVTKPEFQARKTIQLTQPKKENETKNLKLDFPENFPENLKSEITDNCSALIDELVSGKINNQNLFSDAFGTEKANKIIRFNKATPQKKINHAKVLETKTGWEVREIPVVLNEKGLKGIVDNLVIDFDSSGKVSDLNYSIGRNDFQNFYKTGELVNDWKERQVIVKFLETFKTDYNTRRIESIEKIYDENAEIIIGKIITSQPVSVEIKTNLNNQKVEYVRKTKKEYLKNLSLIFSEEQNPFLYFQYDDLEVIKNRQNGTIYGVHLRQNFISSSYSDEGYLCLVVNFGKEPPLIHFRAWLPNEWSEEDLIKISDFEIK
ncbi:hypothetical protein IT568_02490 [bacterium]|nr:hypothetical protein [bacterium]